MKHALGGADFSGAAVQGASLGGRPLGPGHRGRPRKKSCRIATHGVNPAWKEATKTMKGKGKKETWA